MRNVLFCTEFIAFSIHCSLIYWIYYIYRFFLTDLLPFASEPKNLILHLDDTAMFECDIDGLPDPEITWFKNDRLLSESDNINIR